MEHLYNQKDITRIRSSLLEEQNNICKITGCFLEDKPVLDHNHDTQFVRGVVHRQANAALGKIENLWKRYLSHWYPGTLPEFLNECAYYIDSDNDVRYVHPGWIKKVKIEFRKLSEVAKDKVLVDLGSEKGNNAKRRLELFGKLIMSRQFTYSQLKNIIKKYQQGITDAI